MSDEQSLSQPVPGAAPPAGPPPAVSPELQFSHALRRPPRVVLGPGLWIFGALLWSYAILGQFVMSGFPESIAVLTLLFVVSVTYSLAVRDALAVVPAERALRGRRWVWPGVVAVGCWLATMLLVTLIGKSSHQNMDKPITLLLMVLSAVAIVLGRRFTHPGRPARSKGKLALSVATWTFAVLAALVALAMD